MKLTAKARYAVTAMADISRFGDGGAVALGDIAARQRISLSFLEQLFRKLREAGLVTSQRGAGGGYCLLVTPEEIRIADIVRAVDENIITTACSPEALKGCTGTSARCLTHDLWDELGRHIDVFLSAITLQDILDKRVLGRASIGEPLTPASIGGQK
jgi:Rrf2 family transcriptional regulator, iron-sulfur cluster assembly transcription factor